MSESILTFRRETGGHTWILKLGRVGYGTFYQLTCSESCLPLRKKPSRQPMTTANTDKMSSPFCLQTFFTRPHTSSRATAILLHYLLLLLLLLLVLVLTATLQPPLRENHPLYQLFSHIEPAQSRQPPLHQKKQQTVDAADEHSRTDGAE